MTKADYKFTDTCTSAANTCEWNPTATGYSASCVNTTLDTGACKIDDSKSFIILENQGAMYKTNWYRI